MSPLTTLAVGPLARLGDTDCEAFDHGLVAQSTNTWTSLAYIAIGVALIVVAVKRPSGVRAAQLIFGLAVASVGVGSMLFHGPQWPGSRWLHDLSIVAAFGFIGIYDLTLALGWTTGRFLRFYLWPLVAISLLFALAPDSSLIITGVIAVAGVAAEVVAYRRGCRRPDGRFGGWFYWIAGALLVVALTANLLTSTGAPFCDPDDLIQGHGIWHVLTALAFGAWAIDGLRRRAPAASSPVDLGT